MRIGEQLLGLLWGHPAKLVDLPVGLEFPLGRLHQPVADQLPAPLAVEVGDVRQLGDHLAAVAGLLLDLPQRRLQPVLALLELALRERPVAVLRTVDDRDPLAPVPVRGDQDAAGRGDIGLAVPDLEVLAAHPREPTPGHPPAWRRNTIAACARWASISPRSRPTRAPAGWTGGSGPR